MADNAQLLGKCLTHAHVLPLFLDLSCRWSLWPLLIIGGRLAVGELRFGLFLSSWSWDVLGSIKFIDDKTLLTWVLRRYLDRFRSENKFDCITQGIAFSKFIETGWLVILDADEVLRLQPDHGGETGVNGTDPNQACIKIDYEEAIHDCIWVVIVVKKLLAGLDESHWTLWLNQESALARN